MVDTSLKHFGPWVKVLGQSLESDEYSELLDSLSIPAKSEEVKKYSDGTTYHCYYSLGLALSFTPDNILDSVDFYQPNSQRKFSRYKAVSDEVLGSSTISRSTTGKEFVDLFGEPTEKGGGVSRSIDIWLRWVNLEVQISNRDWDTAKDDPWSSITIFR